MFQSSEPTERLSLNFSHIVEKHSITNEKTEEKKKNNNQNEIKNKIAEPCTLLSDLPINAFAMVILSHILSRTSRPDSGQAMALAIVAMSLWMERWKSSNPGKDHKTSICVTTGGQPRTFVRGELVCIQLDANLMF